VTSTANAVRAACAAAFLLASCAAAAASAADPAKVLRIALPRGETGFDPAQASEIYSSAVIAAIMEPLLTFDYLARPVKVIPLTATAMPDVADNGKTYTFHIRPEIFFAADPAFGNSRRELVAEDYIYAIERLIDPANRSPNAFYVQGKIVGLEAVAAAAKKPGAHFDYAAQVAGLEALDRYTLRIRLESADFNFPSVMAQPSLSPVAREVVAAYPGDVAAHPVGTGPYVLKSWQRASLITLVASPSFRPFTWNFAAGSDPEDKAIVAAMRGKQMPQIGVIEIHVMEEDQSRWLAFQRGDLDLVELPATFGNIALSGGHLVPDLARKGVRLSRIVDPAITYTAFNLRDPVVGGSTPEKIALRRAIAMAYDVQAEIDIVRKGQAVALETIIPPGVAGHSPTYRSGIVHDIAAANQLLDRMGYRKGGDGYRTQLDGKPLTVRLSSQNNATSRDYDELWKKAFDAVAIRMDVDKGNFSDQIKAAIACHHQFWTYGWIADYPDGDNFMQLLYGKNINQSNVACYSSPAFDRLYEKSRTMPDSPERSRLFEQMQRQFEIDAPWRLHVAAYRNVLMQPRVIGYKAHPVLLGEWIYSDLEAKAH
jgi:oligopeptide transport system substrate-binding protein